jgi:hypothetical protein
MGLFYTISFYQTRNLEPQSYIKYLSRNDPLALFLAVKLRLRSTVTSQYSPGSPRRIMNAMTCWQRGQKIALASQEPEKLTVTASAEYKFPQGCAISAAALG